MIPAGPRYGVNPTSAFILATALSILAACTGSTDETGSTPECTAATSGGLGGLTGSYGAGGPTSDDVVRFTARDGAFLMGPALWSGPMVLSQVGPDSFQVATHPRFGAAFERGPDGCATSARVYGLSPEIRYRRLSPDSLRPIQMLEQGQPREAARAYAAADPAAVERYHEIGVRRLRSAPTELVATVAFLDELTSRVPGAAPLHVVHGDALVYAGDRPAAERAYRRALTLDPENGDAVTRLTRLGVLEPESADGWSLPFSTADLLAPPRPAEVEAVWREWAARDLDPGDVAVVARHPVDLDGTAAEARLVRHTVHGERHYGVVIVPDGGSAARPVVVEAKGVSPDFFPLQVPDGITSVHFMAAARGDVIYAAPGYRGERVIVGSDTVTSDGDRSDAWEGATDDLIAFTRAALLATPEADAARLCVFGRSRGGTVALLAGIREPRFDCVVAWAAPTDWFRNMDLMGWRQAELVEEGLRSRSEPGETGGQFINYFLTEAIAGERDLEATRRHLIASSPLYFAERMPLAQVHWGLDDSIVPSVNGRTFVERYLATGRAGRCLDIRMHPDAGHDQDRQLAPELSRAFLLRAFGLSDRDLARCRP